MAEKQVLRRIIHDMGKYVMFLFENEPPVEDEEPKEPKGKLHLAMALKTHLLGCVSHLRDCSYVHAFDHYVATENPENKLRTSILNNLMELSRTLPHMRFLRECAMHYITASILKELGLQAAPEIVEEAIYLSCIATKHGEHLQLWGYVNPFDD